MMLIELQYIGKDPVLVRQERGAKKVEVKTDETVLVQEPIAKNLLKVYSRLFVKVGTQVDEDAVEAKKAKAKERAKAEDARAKRLAEKAKGGEKNTTEAAATGEAPSYDEVMGMDLAQLVALNDAQDLGVRIQKNSKVETIREKVAEALELAPEETKSTLETFKAMVDNRTPEQLEKMSESVDEAVATVEEDGQEEAREYLEAKLAELAEEEETQA